MVFNPRLELSSWPVSPAAAAFAHSGNSAEAGAAHPSCAGVCGFGIGQSGALAAGGIPPEAMGPHYDCVARLPGMRLKRSLLRSEEHTSELQSLRHLVCRLLLE